MRSAFQKLVASKITFDILTSDKFEYANDAPDKSAPARLLFLILVRSALTKLASVRFVFCKLVSIKISWHRIGVLRQSSIVPVRSLPDRSTFSRLALVRSAPTSIVQLRSKPDR